MDLTNCDVMRTSEAACRHVWLKKRNEKKYEKIKKGDGFCPDIVHDL